VFVYWDADCKSDGTDYDSDMSKSNLEDWVNTLTAAEIIGCTEGRVRQLAADGSIRGAKFNLRAWMILRTDAEKYRDIERHAGRRRISEKLG